MLRRFRRATTFSAHWLEVTIAEGCERTGGDRHYHDRVALGSSREALSLLRGAVDWGYIEPEDVAPARGSMRCSGR